MLAYLRLLLINRLRGFQSVNLSRKKRGKVATGLTYAMLVLLAVYVYAIVVFLEIKLYDAAAVLGQPQLIIAVMLMGMTFLTLIYSFFYLTSLLFFSRDNGLLAALPISSTGILTSRVLTVAGGEAGLSLLCMAPLIVRYGMGQGMDVGFYVRSLLGIAALPLLPITLTTLLSFALIRLSRLWKRREALTIVISFLFLAATMYLSMSLSMSTSDQSDEMFGSLLTVMTGKGSLTDIVLGAYPPLRWLSQALTGGGLAAWGWMALFVLVSAGAIALVIRLLGGGYMRLALRQQEIMRRMNATKRAVGKDRVRSPFAALLRQELREVITVPTYATNCLTGIVMFPLMLILMYISFQNQMPDENLVALVYTLLPKEIYLAIFIAFCSFTTCMNMAIATAVSREGNRHDMRKTYPIAGHVHLMAKMVMGMIFNLCTMTTVAILMFVLMPGFALVTVAGVALSQLFSFLWCSVSLLIDVYHPKLNWKTETEAVKQNMNALLGSLGAMGVIAALVGVFFLGLYWQWSVWGALGLVLLVLAALDVIMARWLFRSGSRTYYLR